MDSNLASFQTICLENYRDSVWLAFWFQWECFRTLSCLGRPSTVRGDSWSARRYKESDVSINTLEVVKESILAAIAPKYLNNAKAPWCDDYSPIYRKLEEDAKASQDLQAAGAFRLLWAVTSFRLGTDSVEVFRPVVEFGDGSRSPILADLDDAEIELLESVLEEIEDVDLRARVGDSQPATSS